MINSITSWCRSVWIKEYAYVNEGGELATEQGKLKMLPLNLIQRFFRSLGYYDCTNFKKIGPKLERACFDGTLTTETGKKILDIMDRIRKTHSLYGGFFWEGQLGSERTEGAIFTNPVFVQYQGKFFSKQMCTFDLSLKTETGIEESVKLQLSTYEGNKKWISVKLEGKAHETRSAQIAALFLAKVFLNSGMSVKDLGPIETFQITDPLKWNRWESADTQVALLRQQGCEDYLKKNGHPLTTDIAIRFLKA